MFGKLLKYELKSNYKLFGILSLVALVIGLAGGTLIRGMFITADLVKNEFALGMAEMSLFSMATLCFAAISIYTAAVQYINYYRFYKHKFTDEGYLTFTLPVKAESIFWSSFLNIFAWMILSTIVAGVAAALMFTIGVGPWIVKEIMNMLREIGPMPPLEMITWEEWKELLSLIWDLIEAIVKEGMLQTGAPLYYCIAALQTILTPFYSMILTMSCIVVGSVLVKKMKLLVSIGIYVVFTAMTATLLQISVYVPSFVASLDYTHYFYWMSMPLIGQVLLQVGVIIGGYFLCIHLMKKKLNLP